MKPIDLEITDLTLGGVGIAHNRGKAIFVPDALPGEILLARIVKRHASYDEARGLEYMRVSHDRQIPRCNHFGKCGGCTLQMLDPDRQVELKSRTVLQILERVGSVRPEVVDSPSRTSPWFYRRRARFHPRKVSQGIAFGYQGIHGSTVVPIQECPILESDVQALPGRLTQVLGTLDISRRIRQIELVRGDRGQALILYLKQTETSADRKELESSGSALGIPLYLASPASSGFSAIGLNTELSLSYRIDEFDLDIGFGLSDFIQVNRDVNLKLVHDVVDWLAIAPTDRVLDLYAGVGNFTLPLAQTARAVTAVEGSVSAIESLKRNLEQNQKKNVSVQQADLNRVPAGKWSQEAYQAVVLDPPRAGASSVLPHLAHWKPRRILYVSCHPGTLARDARILVQVLGYTFNRLKIYDMFPHTEHVEALAMFDHA